MCKEIEKILLESTHKTAVKNRNAYAIFRQTDHWKLLILLACPFMNNLQSVHLLFQM